MLNDVYIGVKIPVLLHFDEFTSPLKYQEALALDYHFNAVPVVTSRTISEMAQHTLKSPEHTQCDNIESDNNISSCSTLEISKVEHMSINQLETQVRELNQCLQLAEEQRVQMQYLLDESTTEKELCLRRLEGLTAAHECRITEMHCVIAELSKKLHIKQERTIVEEQEPEGSEISFQDGSIYNSELNLTNPEAECRRDQLDTYAENSTTEECHHIDDQLLLNDVLGDDEFHKLNDNVMNSDRNCEVEVLQEEVLHLRAQIALLQSEIANSLHLQRPPSGRGDHTEHDIMVEKDIYEFYNDYVEANDCNCSLEQQSKTDKEEDEDLNDLNLSLTTLKQCETLNSPQDLVPIPKVAERVKLNCINKRRSVSSIGDNIIATNLLKNEIKNIDVEEHLVSDMVHNYNMTESFLESTQLSNEMQSLKRKLEHLTTHNTVLTLTLDECKEHCEHLYLLCGKYESNAIALQSAVNCSDRGIEAYDVMLALLESKLALMTERTDATEENRKAVESVARHLLNRFESERHTFFENSLGPWQNASFSIPEKATTPWMPEDDNRLRYHVSKLKGTRSTVQNTIVNLESPFSAFHKKSRITHECIKQELCQNNTQIDLESEVLTQELLNLREENILLRKKADEATRERQYAIDNAGELQKALQQLQIQFAMQSTSQLISRQKQNPACIENCVSHSEVDQSVLTEQQLIEALGREIELKGRIQTLVASASATQKISEEKYEQLYNRMRELQKSNVSLTQILEHNKRKYQLRIRKFEQKITDLTHVITQLQCVVKSSTTITKKNNDTSIFHGAVHDEIVPETTL